VIREGLGCTGFNGAGSPANNTAGACPPSARCWLSQSAATASPVSWRTQSNISIHSGRRE